MKHDAEPVDVEYDLSHFDDLEEPSEGVEEPDRMDMPGEADNASEGRTGADFEAAEELQEELGSEIIQWSVVYPTSPRGSRLRGKALNGEEPKFILSKTDEDGENAYQVVLSLSQATAMNLRDALEEAVEVFNEPAPVKKTIQQKTNSVIEWHMKHKVLGTFSALFWGSLVFFIILGAVNLFGA